MTTTSTTLHRSFAALNLPKNVSALIMYAQLIVKAMTGNAAFPSPTPTLTQVSQAMGDLQAAETAALARTRGTVAIRDEKRATLVMLLQELRATVQAAANANLETSASVIQSAGLPLRKTFVRAGRVFAAKAGPVSGSVQLVTGAAAKRASYEWQYSTAPRSEIQRENGLAIAPGRFGAIRQATPSRPRRNPRRAPGAAAGTVARCSR